MFRLAIPLSLAFAAHVSAAQAPPAPLPLDWCVERAASSNPEIALASAAGDAALHRVGPAGALEDPRFGYEASNIPTGDFDFGSTPLSGHQFGLRQKVPFPGVLGSRRDAAGAQARAASFSIADRRLLVASAVETAWSDLGFAQRAVDITDRNIALLRQLHTIAEARYRVGAGLQQDVLRAQVQLTTLLQERLQREAAIEAAGARLAALLDVPAETRFPTTAPLADTAVLPELASVLEGLESRSPRLRALKARIESARSLVRVAELEGYPDFDLGVGYRLRKNVVGDPVGGDDFVSAGVTIRVPWNRSKWGARVAERQALLRGEEARYRSALADLASRVRSAHAELVRADAEASLLASGLVPQARQSLDSSRSGYEVGRIDFLSLLDSQVRLLEAELQLVRAVADRRRSYAALEAAAGERLR
jgi:outer membrane protein TolC